MRSVLIPHAAGDATTPKVQNQGARGNVSHHNILRRGSIIIYEYIITIVGLETLVRSVHVPHAAGDATMDPTRGAPVPQ